MAERQELVKSNQETYNASGSVNKHDRRTTKLSYQRRFRFFLLFEIQVFVVDGLMMFWILIGDSLTASSCIVELDTLFRLHVVIDACWPYDDF